jgi:hypothetical protein
VSESYDAELSRALKESAAKELGGWEFTPAMRAKVLEQIRVQESGQSAPAAPAPRRFVPALVLRPLAWVAVAAAAFAVVLNVGIPGASKKEAAQAPAAAPSEMAATTPEPRFADTSGTAGQGGPVQATSALQPGGETGIAPVQQGGKFKAPGIASVAIAPNAVELTLPVDGVAIAVAPPAEEPGIAAIDHGNTSMTLMAAMPRNVALASGSPLVALTEGAVQQLNADGVPVWEQPLENLTDTSAVALAPDGRVAVANGAAELTVLTASGEHQRTLKTSAAAGSLLWSPDGRLAAAEGELVFVYNTATGKREFFVAAGTPADMAFLADGSLATFGGQVGDPATLVVVDQKGAVLAERVSDTGGRGLAVTVGGSIIVAGGRAYDMAGNPLWKLSIVPMGVAALGSDMVAAWDAETVAVLNGHDGSLVLEASWKGGGQGVRRVIPSADGRYLAILAETEQGPVVWVVDGSGAQVYAEKLGETPVDLALSGNRLMIMLAHSLVVRDLPQ